MNLNVTNMRPFVPSGKDYSLAQRFFEELGFEKMYSDNDITIFRIGEQEFFLQNYQNEELQQNFMIELTVTDLDQWWDYIQEKELVNRYPIKVREPKLYPWGKREIHLIDPAGVCWHISEAIDR